VGFESYFAYGGSTVVVVFAQRVVECVSWIRWKILNLWFCRLDEDLVRNSMQPIETLVKVCWYSILMDS